MLKTLTAAALCCATLATASALAGGTSSVGVPNPASVLCVDLDGNLATLNFPEGQVGVCNLSGGLIDEWTLFRSVSLGESTQAVRLFLEHLAPLPPSPCSDGAFCLPNPASSYCRQLGGQSAQPSDGGASLCRFPDRSAIEEWTLFQGPDVHIRLATILRGQG